MMKMVLALVVSAGIAVAPNSPLLAEASAAMDADAVANAWVPASQAEREAARGGERAYGQIYTITNVLSVFCLRLTVSVPFCKRVAASLKF